MIPRVTVLQLDTDFPRIAGDVGCAQTYARAPQIIRIAGASVGRIVTSRPQDIDITPFEQALARATGDIIVTSCGFLSYWQTHLAACTDRPFIASALVALDRLAPLFPPQALCIATYDAQTLGAAHLRGHDAYAQSVLGLPDSHALRRTIHRNLPRLDVAQATQQTARLLRDNQTAAQRHILLECTNLPPYRAAISAATGLPVTDILTEIERLCPRAIAPPFS